MPRIASFVVVVCASVLSACASAPIAYLPTPPNADASLEKRVAYYDKFSPDGETATVTTYVPSGGSMGAPAQSGQTRLVLKDGHQVLDPRELQPAVPSTSPSVQHIAAYGSLVERERVISAVTWWSFAGSTAIGVAGAGLLLVGFVEGDESLLVAGFGTAIIGGIIGAVGTLCPPFFGPSNADFEAERRSVWLVYDDDLMSKLALRPKSSDQATHTNAPSAPPPPEPLASPSAAPSSSPPPPAN